ncbi:MAG: hypothetical protein J5626_07585 [Lachnospiraceae bacterium]|nr:hypothetical protein [Lachnospiraceae bacterium]
MFKGKLDKKYIIPLIHFLLTFVWERFVLIPGDYARVLFSTPLTDRFSDGFEQAMCYCISKVMAGIVIFLLWKLIFDVFGGKIRRETAIVFGAIWVIGVLVTVILWPDVFEAGGDNYIPYSYAIRLMPEYWHSVYLTCLYVASLMVFPHAVSINILLMTAFVVAVGYLYNRIAVSPAFESVRWVRFLTLLLFVLRDTFTVSTNPERAEYNASFTLLFISIILMDMIEGKKRNKGEFTALLVFAAFLAKFRSEGIIVAVLGFAALVIVVYKPRIMQGVALLAAFGVLFVAFSYPIKVGDIKYYGSDYSIVNAFNPLHNILCCETANLSYEGAAEDLAAIDAVTPIELIKEFSSEGYRRHNYAAGRADINQSMAGEEASKAFKLAYYSIVAHNLGIYLKTQVHMLLQAIGTGDEGYVEAYKGEPTGMPMFGSELWEVGRQDWQTVPGRYIWTGSGIRNSVAVAITVPRLKYVDLLTETKIYSAWIVIEFILGAVLVIGAIVGLTKKKYDYLAPGIMALILDGYVVLLALVMPVGANMYFHAFIYAMAAVLTVSLAIKRLKQAKK